MAENDGAQMHSILLEEREKLRVTGVSDVQSFDEEQVLLETGKGMLIVRGQGLHVEKLQLDAGETVVRGEISLLEYDDSVPPRGGGCRSPQLLQASSAPPATASRPCAAYHSPCCRAPPRPDSQRSPRAARGRRRLREVRSLPPPRARILARQS